MFEEKRNFQRFTINQLVELDFGSELFLKAEGINISESGILCITNEQCDQGARVYLILTLTLSDANPVINCEGEVVRSRKHKGVWETGLRITRIDDVSRHVLSDFIRGLN